MSAITNLPRQVSTNLEQGQLQYVGAIIVNPIGNVQFRGNDVFTTRDLLLLQWIVSDNSIFSGKIDISSNIIYRNWPFQNGSDNDPTTVFRIYGFNVPDQFDIAFDDNSIGDGFWRYNPNSIGLELAYSTHAAVTGNYMEMQGIGIKETVVGEGNTFYCTNIFDVSIWCENPNGIGIMQIGDAGRSFVKKNVFARKEKGFVAGGYNRSTMIRNDFHYNYVGAHFEGNASTIFTGSHTGGDNYAGFNLFEGSRDYNVKIEGWGNAVQPEFGAPTSMLPGEIDTWGQNIFEDYNASGGYSNKHMKFTDLGGGNSTMTLNVPISGNQFDPTAILGDENFNSWYVAPYAEMIKIAHRNKENGDVPRGDYYCGGGSSPISKGASVLSTATPFESEEDSLYLYYAALRWDGIDYRKALDTMRLYCEEHPFATEYPGQIILGIRYTHLFTGGLPETGVEKWKTQYTWLDEMQTRNDDRGYQMEVLGQMCAALVAYDRNGAANLWYNVTLLYKELYNMGWNQIKNIREYQGYIDEDTTAFFIIDKIQPKAEIALSKQGDNSDIVLKGITSDTRKVIVTFDSRHLQEVRFEVYDLVGTLRYSGLMPNAYVGQHQHEMQLDFSGGAFIVVHTDSGSQTIPFIVR